MFLRISYSLFYHQKLNYQETVMRYTMFFKSLSFSIISMVLLSCQQGPGNSNKEAVSLFNGNDLSGWKIHGTEFWYVDSGDLVCESGPDQAYGYLATEKVFGDFELTLEFKQESDGNSGVFFRSSLDGIKISGWQVEVAPPGRDTGGIYESYGRGWLVQIPEEKEHVLKMGEWNEMRIRVEGAVVNTWLNGEHMVELEDSKIGESTGVLALQIHDGGGIKVRWRNIMILEL